MISPPFTRSLFVALLASYLATAADLTELQVDAEDLQRQQFTETIQSIRDSALSPREQIQRIDEAIRTNPPPARVIEILDPKELPVSRAPRTDEEVMLDEMREILSEIRATAISPLEQIRSIDDFVEVNRESLNWLSDTWMRNEVDTSDWHEIEMPSLEDLPIELRLAIDLEAVREANHDPAAQIKAVDEFLKQNFDADAQQEIKSER